MIALYCYPPESNVVQRTKDAVKECRQVIIWRNGYLEVKTEVPDSYLFVVYPSICTISI
jgi:hypothetical protein